MSYNKNVVEDALFQIKNLEETLQENAKGILQSTMTEEIKQLVKESLREQDEVDTPPADEDDDDMAMDDMAMDDDEMADDDDEMADDDDEMADDDDEMAMDDDEMAMDDDEMAMDDDEMDMDDDEMAMDDEDAIDMTDASDEEVLKVFRAMGDEDGIVVKKDGDFIHLTDDDDDYLIQLGESIGSHEGADWNSFLSDESSEELDEMKFGHKHFSHDDDDDEEFNEETIYEISMDESPEMDEWSWGGALEGGIKGGLGLDEEWNQMDENAFLNYADSLEEDLYESKKSVTPKGVGIGRGPKFSYDKKPNMGGGFSEKKKEAFGKGVKAMGTGKAKFEYKEEKEWGSKKGEFRRKKEDGVEKKAGKKDGHYKDYEKMETKEAARNIGNGSKDGSRGLRKGRMNNRNYEYNPFKISEGRSNEEVQLLKEKNEEYKQALDVFRTKLNEVAVFNSNLAYATRLFTEHSTTKQEKINILRRFDNVESLKESKNLYRTIKGELSSSGSVGEQKINESIERTVNKTVETGSSVNLIESKTYENPQFLRMKDLMGKLK